MSHVLKIGSHGGTVRPLQAMLKHYDPALVTDGAFGPRTERAVRLAQRRLGLFPPDGIAGPITLGALAKAAKPASVVTGKSAGVAEWVRSICGQIGSAVTAIEKEVSGWLSSPSTPPPTIPKPILTAVKPAIRHAQTGSMSPGVVKNPAILSMSELGRQFVFRHEAGDGRLTAHLHFPGGSSGVTLGPGYDMKARTEAEVANDLVNIGVGASDAAAAAKGATLKGADAVAFAHANRNLLNLNHDQQVLLQLRYKARYENMVRHGVKIPLHQYEFDALVSYAGNPGSSNGWLTTIKLVNERKNAEAMVEIKKFVYTGHAWSKGLANRRDAEARLFLYADYKA